MNLFPFAKANFDPTIPPIALHKAIGIAICQSMTPFKVNNTIDPKLVAKFTTFACALAC